MATARKKKATSYPRLDPTGGFAAMARATSQDRERYLTADECARISGDLRVAARQYDADALIPREEGGVPEVFERSAARARALADEIDDAADVVIKGGGSGRLEVGVLDGE